MLRKLSKQGGRFIEMYKIWWWSPAIPGVGFIIMDMHGQHE